MDSELLTWHLYMHARQEGSGNAKATEEGEK